MLYGKIPRLPKILNEKTIMAQKQVAIFLLTCFKPWCSVLGIPKGRLTWNNCCSFLQDLASPTADANSRNILFTIKNIIDGLSISTKKQRMFGKYRSRGTIPWGSEKNVNNLERQARKEFAEALKSISNGDENNDAVPDDDAYDVQNEIGLDYLDTNPDGDVGEESKMNKESLIELYNMLAKNALTGESASGKPDLGKAQTIEYNEKAVALISELFSNQNTDATSVPKVTPKSPKAKTFVFDIKVFKSSTPTQDTTEVNNTTEIGESIVEESQVLKGKDFFDDFIRRVSQPAIEISDQIDTDLIASEMAKNIQIHTTIDNTATGTIPLVDLVENGNELADGCVGNIPAGVNQLNEKQEFVCSKLYKNIRNNINFHVNPITTPNQSDPVYLILQGGPGAGKTTLFVELIRRVRAYLTRKRERLQEMVRDELRGGLAASSLSDRLKQLIFRINKVVFGFKQCATTGAAAVVVGNKCVTMHSLHAIPIAQITKKVSDETHMKKSDNYRKGPLTLQQIADYQDMFQKAGCFMVSIDEVSHRYFSLLLIFYYYLISIIIFIFFRFL